MPAQAGIHLDSGASWQRAKWIPACAGMTPNNGAEVCDQNFLEFVQNWQGGAVKPSALSPQPSSPVLPGSLCSVGDFIDLFDSQLVSRHLDLMARVLRVKNKVFYTIGSSGHEGNAMVARLTRH